MAALIRFVPVLLDPIFSSDVYRYAWEGRIQAFGGWNPFLSAPASPVLRSLRDSYWEFINYPELSAVYGGFAQLLFAGVAALAGSATMPALKFVTAGIDFLNVVLLRRLSPSGPNRSWPLVLYAWNPACALEFGWSGHLDSILIFLILAAILTCRNGQPDATGALLALAAGVKWWPAVLLFPALLTVPTRVGGQTRAGARLRLVGAFLGVTLLVWSPYVSAGSALFRSLQVMQEQFQFNPSLFTALEETVRGPAAWWVHARLSETPQVARLLGFNLLQDPAGQVARLILAAAGGTLVGVLLWRRVSLERAAYLITTYLIITSTVVHPWYTLLPLALSIVLGRGIAAWTWLSAASVLSYLAYISSPLDQLVWVRLLQYVPFYACLLIPPALRQTRLKQKHNRSGIFRELTTRT